MIRIAAALLLAALAGCASAPVEQHYVLSPVAGAARGSLPDVPIAVAMARVTEAVDRPQLVVSASENRVRILEQQRWAEPLKSGIPRVVAANLGQLLGTSRVSAYPNALASDTGLRIGLDVKRFESRPGEGVNVEIDWTVRRGSGEPRLGRSVVSERVSGADYEALVAAHSRALATVSGEIAQAILAAR
jgi:hypothetical protein